MRKGKKKYEKLKRIVGIDGYSGNYAIIFGIFRLVLQNEETSRH